MALTSYLGGKNAEGVYHRIINEIRPHDRFHEPFVGSGAIIRRIMPARQSFACDLDLDVLVDLKNDFPRVHIKNMCGLQYLRTRRFGPGDFIYIDAPYLREVRTSPATRYKFEFDTPEQHQALIQSACDASSFGAGIAISHYPCDLYDRALAHWRKVEYTVGTRGGGSRIEALYVNYPRPAKLHDARFIGRDFRHREKLNRRVATMMGKLERWFGEDEQFVQAYLAAIDEWRARRLDENR